MNGMNDTVIGMGAVAHEIIIRHEHRENQLVTVQFLFEHWRLESGIETLQVTAGIKPPNPIYPDAAPYEFGTFPVLEGKLVEGILDFLTSGTDEQLELFLDRGGKCGLAYHFDPIKTQYRKL